MASAKEIVSHPDMPPAYGAYSPAVRAGDFVFVAGIAGIVAETGTAAEGDFAAEARQAFENLKLTLGCAGADLADVVRCTTYLADPDGGPTLNALFAEYFGDAPPARSSPIVTLPRGLRLSLEATAYRPR